MNSKHIFIAGSDGFIGKNIAKHFMDIKYPNLTLLNRKNLPLHYNGRASQIRQKCRNNGVVLFASENSIYDYKLIDEGNKLLNCLTEESHGNIIYLSSSNVYGSCLKKNFSEISVPKPLTPYGKLKLIREKNVLVSGGTVLRLSNIIGNGMSSFNILSEIIFSLKNSNSVSVRNLNDVRDYLFVDDLKIIISKIILNTQPGIFNVGSGQLSSVLDMIKIVGKSINKRKYEIIDKSNDGKFSKISLDIDKVCSIYKIKNFTPINIAINKILETADG